MIRADENLHTLQRYIREWRGAGDTHRITSSLNETTGDHYVTIETIKPLEHVRWGMVLGDFVHNLRSALDHLVWQLTIVRDGSPPDPIPRHSAWEAAQFPILSNPSDWLRVDRKGARKGRPSVQTGMGRVERVPPLAQTRIKRLQPFATRQPERHPLWVLAELSNIDKHRFPHLVGFVARPPKITYPAASNVELVYKTSPRPFIRKTLLAHNRVDPREAAGSMQMEYPPLLDVAFSDGPPAYGGSLLETIGAVYQFVICTLYAFDDIFSNRPTGHT